jgi:hypothetical protein
MTVYTAGWIPHSVKIQSTGSSVFLGAIINMDNSGADTFQWLTDTAKLACNTIRSKPGFSGASKVAVLSTSTINGMVYKAAASVLSHSQLHDIDSIIDNVLITSTQNMHSFPRKLIHIDRKHGGLGIMSFSCQTELRKLQKLFSCLRSQQIHGQAAKGLLSRLARKHGYHASSNQQLIISLILESRKASKLFLDGPQEMLASYGLYFCRAGVPDSQNELRCLLPVFIPRDDK